MVSETRQSGGQYRTEPDRPIVHRRGRRRTIKASNSKDKTRNIAPSSMMKLPEAAVPAADECGPLPPQTFWPRPTKMSSTLRVSSVYTTHGRSNRFNRVTASGLMTGVEPVLESSTRNVPMPSDGRVKQIQGPAAQGWCPLSDGWVAIRKRPSAIESSRAWLGRRTAGISAACRSVSPSSIGQRYLNGSARRSSRKATVSQIVPLISRLPSRVGSRTKPARRATS